MFLSPTFSSSQWNCIGMFYQHCLTWIIIHQCSSQLCLSRILWLINTITSLPSMFDHSLTIWINIWVSLISRSVLINSCVLIDWWVMSHFDVSVQESNSSLFLCSSHLTSHLSEDWIRHLMISQVSCTDEANRVQIINWVATWQGTWSRNLFV